MSPRIVGTSGEVLDVSASMALSLVRDGYAKLADGEPEEALVVPAPAVVLINPEASPGVALPVGNSIGDIVNQPSADGRPRGNASRDEWVAYAVAKGKTEDDLIGLKQGQIRDLFTERTAEQESTDTGLNAGNLDANPDAVLATPTPLDVPPHTGFVPAGEPDPVKTAE